MNELWPDVRYGIRVLLRAPGFTILAVIVLGLGIGVSTTIFSAINGVLWRPLPYRDPGRLVALWESNPRLNAPRAGTSAPSFVAWQQLNRTLDGLAAYRHWGFDLTGVGEPERLLGGRVSANLFSLLGVQALMGRTFVPADDSVGQPSVALIGEELWRRRFGADPGVLGRPLNLDGQAYTVVGVVPRGFALPEAELWVPLRFAPYEMQQRGDRALSVVGRLKSRDDVPAATADLRSVAHTLEQQFPTANAGWQVTVSSLQDDVSGVARMPLLLLFAATCAVLIVACANLANLLLARSAVRRREIALRAALGAGSGRIARQLITESLLLVAAAGALGLLIASVGAGLLAHADSGLLPRSQDIRIDPVVLGFVVLVSLVTGAGLSLVPTLDAVRLDLNWVIKARDTGGRRSWAGLAWRDVPIVGEVALALLLLVGGGLLVRSFMRAQAVDLGFSAERVLSMTVSLPASRYVTNERKAAFFEDLGRRVGTLPGVRSAALVSHPPLAAGALRSDVMIEGRPLVAPGEVPNARLVNVTPGYFETLSIPVLHGRSFGASDRAGTPPVVVIDETLARRYWGSANLLGRRVRLGATLGADTAWREIIGVVAGVRSATPERAPEPTLYIPHAQNPWPTMGLVVKTSGDAAALTKAVIGAVRAVDPNQPVYNVRSFDEVVGRTLGLRRLQTVLMAGFAVAALLLALVGVYGMLAYAVAQRTRELGIRVALGAQRHAIVWHCLQRALVPIGAGLVIGILAALTAAQFLRALLFALDPWDPATFAGALLLLGSASAVACCVPAMRAANVDPLLALRSE